MKLEAPCFSSGEESLGLWAKMWLEMNFRSGHSSRWSQVRGARLVAAHLCQGSGEPPISGYGVSLWRQGDVLELTVVMGDGVKPCKKPLARVESE